jgi:hypothetical protein
MARDLIPPPSPAGQPSPDGGNRQREDLRDAPRPHGDDFVLAVRPDDGEGASAERDAHQTPEEVAEAVESPHRARFGLILGGLVGLGLAAVVLLVLTLAGRDSPSSDIAWSNWRPSTDDKYLAAREIADHVGREYRLDDGTQLVDVKSGPIAINDIPLTVTVHQQTEKGDILRVGDKGIWYVLNGLGERGSIARGTPSAARLALVKREALELALYTFRYVHDVDHVVTLLPPPPPNATAVPTAKAKQGAKAQATPTPTPTPTATPAASTSPIGQQMPAMLFRPEQLASQLSLPLGLTLDPNTPTPEKLKARDAQLITQFTAPNTFDATIQQNQIGEGLLVLDPPSNLAALQGQFVPLKKKKQKTP